MVDHFLECLGLLPDGDGLLVGASLREVGEGDIVFGGQFLAQIAVAGASVDPSKTVKYVSAMLGRPALRKDPVHFRVEPMHGGRAFATTSVSVLQGGRLLARGQVLLSGDEPDTIRHAPSAPAVPPPDACQRFDGYRVGADARDVAGRELRVVGDFRPSDPENERDPLLHVWARCPGLDAAPVHSQAFAVFASAGPNITTAMLPHKGFGTDMAHESISTGIMSHTMTFHEPFDAREWLLFEHHALYAGRGRSYARGDVFDRTGQLVASFTQDAIIRAYPKDDSLTGSGRTVL